MDKRLTMTVTMTVKEAQALALQAMFECWNNYSSRGCSRWVGFRVDGDGDFHPNCKIFFSPKPRELTQELRVLAIAKDDHGDRLYDYDNIGWKIDT